MNSRYLKFILLCIVFCQSPLHAQDILIKNGTYFDANKKKMRRGDILISDDRITSIGSNLKATEGTTVIDARDKFIIPGLIDAHIHLFQSGGLYTRPDVVDLRGTVPYNEEIKWLDDHEENLLRRYLAIGITSVIDVGGPMKNYDLRDKLKGRNDLPTLFMTGPLVSTYQPAEFAIDDAPIFRVKSEEEARQLVRKQVDKKPDFIKIWYITLPQQSAESTFDIVKAAIDESHKNNLRVAVHATELNTAKLAIHAGADFLVHSVDDEIDEDFITLIKENDVVYCPTLIVHGKYVESLTQAYRPSEEDFKYAHPMTLGSIYDTKHIEDNRDLTNYVTFADNINATLTEQKTGRAKNLALLSKEGITIATGTDAGNIGTQHASSYFEELRLMKEAGMDETEILLASTFGAALAVNRGDQLGRIQENNIADLVILDENPINHLDALQSIHRIVNKGHVINPDTLVKNTPELLVQQQLNGYNGRNIDAFLSPYADDVRIHNFPSTVIMEGKEQMRSEYRKMFAEYPKLHCRLVNRIINGNTIIDHEEITGVGETPWRAIAVYKIVDDKIQEVYFMQ